MSQLFGAQHLSVVFGKQKNNTLLCAAVQSKVISLCRIYLPRHCSSDVGLWPPLERLPASEAQPLSQLWTSLAVNLARDKPDMNFLYHLVSREVALFPV